MRLELGTGRTLGFEILISGTLELRVGTGRTLRLGSETFGLRVGTGQTLGVLSSKML